ncbi:hypothetical protein [Brevibacillus borstelensis]|uniref:hypothetical protein n=1 Tax=Brevibacillus borstelensis TaxID=45462 RepID=UPI00287FF386|nr:hypothetical protein [Brevibacillus borstelensis]WNF07233.1 hypothetical protein RFB14_07345 [Brevibacillus borstelensis]
MKGHDLVIGYEGILNRSMLRDSPPGEVITYKLSEEERLKLIDKYGPPLSRKVNSVTIIRKSLA